jgi:hypothetical protein
MHPDSDKKVQGSTFNGSRFDPLNPPKGEADHPDSSIKEIHEILQSA